MRAWVQVRVLGLNPEDNMKALALQSTPSPPESLLLLDSPQAGTSGEDTRLGSLFLHVGELLAPIM